LPPLHPAVPPQPPEPELLSPRVLTASASHLSLQSSRHNRYSEYKKKYFSWLIFTRAESRNSVIIIIFRCYNTRWWKWFYS